MLIGVTSSDVSENVITIKVFAHYSNKMGIS